MLKKKGKPHATHRGELLITKTDLINNKKDFINNKKGKEGPNIILLGNVNEFKDSPGNYILSGEVKNIGNKRVSQVIRNWAI